MKLDFAPNLKNKILENKIFKNKKNKKNVNQNINPTQTCPSHMNCFNSLSFSSLPFNVSSSALFDSLRNSVPIIDAAINKLVRLVGSFSVVVADKRAQQPLELFLKNVKVGPHSFGIDSFIACYFDSMLTYGNAIGEIVLDRNKSDILALYNSSLDDVKILADKNPLNLCFFSRDSKDGISFVPVKFPQLILFSALNPPPGKIKGVSLLSGLPFVTETLLKIYRSIALNFDRVGNVRFAVTYKPPSCYEDLSSAKDIATNIAQEWSSAMNSDSGTIKDFVAVGDVDVKVIGADNQILDTNIPVRQMLEQIVAKTGIPPFLLGLSWSTSERMSKQQAEILTSELEGYRRVLTPVISKIVGFWLKLNNFSQSHSVVWNPIHLKDEVEISRAALFNAQAKKISQA